MGAYVSLHIWGGGGGEGGGGGGEDGGGRKLQVPLVSTELPMQSEHENPVLEVPLHVPSPEHAGAADVSPQKAKHEAEGLLLKEQPAAADKKQLFSTRLLPLQMKEGTAPLK